jgi:hypothetical protein
MHASSSRQRGLWLLGVAAGVTATFGVYLATLLLLMRVRHGIWAATHAPMLYMLASLGVATFVGCTFLTKWTRSARQGLLGLWLCVVLTAIAVSNYGRWVEPMMLFAAGLAGWIGAQAISRRLLPR